MANELVASSAGTLEQAVTRRVAHLYAGQGIDSAAIDREASFFAPAGFCVGEHILDSLDIVEMIVTLEVDFNVDIVMAHDVTQHDSIAKLCRLLEAIAGTSELALFKSHWRE